MTRSRRSGEIQMALAAAAHGGAFGHAAVAVLAVQRLARLAHDWSSDDDVVTVRLAPPPAALSDAAEVPRRVEPDGRKPAGSESGAELLRRAAGFVKDQPTGSGPGR